ncbi:MAG: ABC transporter ATP-binding protein [Anaerolineaceae bacterium]|nr:ABC transporter ATP-binding protein [Anaerolineaceae bacterium]
MGKPLRSIWLVVTLAARADPRRALLVALMELANGLCVATLPLWLKLLADAAVDRDGTMALVAAAGGACAVTIGIFAGWLGANGQTVLRERTGLALEERLARLSLGVPGLEHHERPDYRDTLALLREERGRLGDSFYATISGLQLVVRFGATLVLLMTVHFSLVLLPVFGLVLLATGRKAERLRQSAMAATAEPLRTAKHLVETSTSAGSAKELLVFGLGDEFLRRHRAIWDGIDRARTRAAIHEVALNTAGWVVLSVGYAAAVALATWLAVEGRATAGDVLMTLSLAGQVHGYVAGGAGQFAWILGTLKAVERLLWLTDYSSDAARTDTGHTPSPRRLTAGIDLKDVSFAYPGTGNEVLSDVSLHLPAGSTVAIVGENGAGKTTLVKLLCRFYEPSQGQIVVDGTGLDQHDLEDWRARVTAAFQDFARFQFVARETVGVGDLQAVEDLSAVERAISRAGAEDVSIGLPSGLETQLGREWKGGVELSEGQWQKLALARALMRERPLLLVLDEPTASLDAETEYALFARYAAAVKATASEVGTITILVSHRFSTVRMADSIVVLDSGRVIEVGNHDALMARGGLYAELYGLQERAYR